MISDRWIPKPYAPEEFLSFDRLKRGVTSRVLERAEYLMQAEFPIQIALVEQLLAEEWQRAKEMLRTSPQAKEVFRRWVQRYVREQVERRIAENKAQLEQFGVAKEYL